MIFSNHILLCMCGVVVGTIEMVGTNPPPCKLMKAVVALGWWWFVGKFVEATPSRPTTSAGWGSFRLSIISEKLFGVKVAVRFVRGWVGSWGGAGFGGCFWSCCLFACFLLLTDSLRLICSSCGRDACLVAICLFKWSGRPNTRWHNSHSMSGFSWVCLCLTSWSLFLYLLRKKKIMSFQMRVSIIRKTGNISWKAGFDDIQWDSWDSLTVRGILDMPTDVLDRAAPDVGPNFFPFEMWDYNHRTDEPVLYEPCVSWLWNKCCKLTYYLLKNFKDKMLPCE